MLAQMEHVASVKEIGSLALIPLGFAMTGWAATQLGAAPTFLWGGLITAMLTSELLIGVCTLRQFD